MSVSYCWQRKDKGSPTWQEMNPFQREVRSVNDARNELPNIACNMPHGTTLRVVTLIVEYDDHTITAFKQ